VAGVPRRLLATTGLLVGTLGGTVPLPAQVTATLDGGFGAIEYAGFLGSTALTVTPGLRYDARSFSLAGQGNWVVYESGRSLLQGAAAGAWLTPPIGPVRGELSGFGGIARYSDEPASGYGLLRARVHLPGRAAGLWAGGGMGRSYVGAIDVGTSEITVGGWVAHRALTATGTLMRGSAADSAFVDLTASARWRHGALELNGIGGARVASAFEDEGLFGELQVRLALTRLLAAQVGAGSYPIDPLRGAVAGRWISAGVRIGLWSGRSGVAAPDERLRATVRLPNLLPPDAPVLILATAAFGVRAITIEAPGAASVDLAGDFTDWQPVALRPVGRDAWRLEMALAPGIYRLNVRIDGGPWAVPRGATPQADEFGTTVGLVVVR
jgi:hypothetical protein